MSEHEPRGDAPEVPTDAKRSRKAVCSTDLLGAVPVEDTLGSHEKRGPVGAGGATLNLMDDNLIESLEARLWRIEQLATSLLPRCLGNGMPIMEAREIMKLAEKGREELEPARRHNRRGAELGVTNMNDSEIEAWMRECDEGKHPLSLEDEAALARAEKGLMRRLRLILAGGGGAELGDQNRGTNEGKAPNVQVCDSERMPGQSK